MSEQICPICGASNAPDAKICVLCEARLPGRSATSTVKAQGAEELAPAFYDAMLGEDDLMARRAPGGIWFAGLFLLVGVLLGLGLAYGITTFLSDDDTRSEALPTDALNVNPTASLAGNFATATAPSGSIPTLIPTNTRIVPNFPTVTPMPSNSPTPSTCDLTVNEGDTLYGLALACGHRDYAVVPLIVETNNLACETCIQIGQVIQVPLPTGTPAPLIDPAATGESSSGGVVVVANTGGATISADDIVLTRAVAAEPTLDPNLMWHTVTNQQTMYDIIAIYNIDIKLLSEINPEMDFPQCDFGERYGGPTCAVFLSEGQRMRVPAPTRTPTLPPTPSGSETPTPTPTATFNVPSLFSPQEGEQFEASRVVTLRWTSTGTLGRDEAYLVKVTNTQTQKNYFGLSCDLSYELPRDWRPEKTDSQEYIWSVSIVLLRPGVNTDGTAYAVHTFNWQMCNLSTDYEVAWEDDSDVGMVAEVVALNERYPTTPRQFFWQGK